MTTATSPEYFKTRPNIDQHPIGTLAYDLMISVDNQADENAKAAAHAEAIAEGIRRRTADIRAANAIIQGKILADLKKHGRTGTAKIADRIKEVGSKTYARLCELEADKKVLRVGRAGHPAWVIPAEDAS